MAGGARVTQRESGFTLVELMITVAILGVLAAITLPLYNNYLTRARQAEPMSQLAGIYVAEISFYGEHIRYSDFLEIGFSLAGQSLRYTYRAQRTTLVGGVVTPGTIQIITPSSGVATAENTVVAAASSASGFTATATANVDADLQLDQWHVNDVRDDPSDPDIDDVTETCGKKKKGKKPGC